MDETNAESAMLYPIRGEAGPVELAQTNEVERARLLLYAFVRVDLEPPAA